MHSRRLFTVAGPLVAALTAFASTALAQDPAPTPAPSKPTTASPVPVAAASAPAPDATPITATCSLGAHAGIDDNEARTTADIVCHELARVHAPGEQHEIRIGKLGGKTLVTLARRNGNTYDERRVFLAGIDEISVAAPRLVNSLVDGKSLAETRDVDNVLASEQRQVKVQQGAMGFDFSIFGTTGIGASAGASGGFNLGLLYRAGNFGLAAQGRAGGIGSGDNKIGHVSLDMGGRYFLTNGDISPFVGAGLGLSHFSLNRDKGGDMSGSGFGAYAQIGAEMLRTHHTAFTVSTRLDLPFYALEGSTRYAGYNVPSVPGGSSYVMPLSLNIGLVFH